VAVTERQNQLRVQEKSRPRITVTLRRDSRSSLETSQFEKCERLRELDSSTPVILVLPRCRFKDSGYRNFW
jgi:hypothetical protein